jgi:hypothetical protein
VADYSKRPEELLRHLETMKPRLPEPAVKSMTDAIGKYGAWRRERLESLLKLIEEDDKDKRLGRWKDLCRSMREEVPRYFDDVFNNIALEKPAADECNGWKGMVKISEDKFFAFLGETSPAAGRDFICENRESLRAYTDTLDQKWRAIVDEGNKLQSEEKKLYDEMVEMTKRIVDEFTITERTYYEKMRNLGQYPLIVVEKLGSGISQLTGLPDGVSDAAEKAAEWLRERNQQWLEGNRNIQGRAANYRALVQAEKGGVLPLFKETRRQVYEYWEKNKIENSRAWMDRVRASLESEWIGSIPTDGQKDDARDFYKAAMERLEKHYKAAEDLAKQFEEKWNGVFKGALAPKTMDELLELPIWQVNAETLASIRTPSVINGLWEKMDGYYAQAFEGPVKKLEEEAQHLEGERKEQALEAAQQIRKRVETAVRDRLKEFHDQVAASLRWFETDEIRRTLDRSELRNNLE